MVTQKFRAWIPLFVFQFSQKFLVCGLVPELFFGWIHSTDYVQNGLHTTDYVQNGFMDFVSEKVALCVSNFSLFYCR